MLSLVIKSRSSFFCFFWSSGTRSWILLDSQNIIVGKLFTESFWEHESRAFPPWQLALFHYCNYTKLSIAKQWREHRGNHYLPYMVKCLVYASRENWMSEMLRSMSAWRKCGLHWKPSRQLKKWYIVINIGLDWRALCLSVSVCGWVSSVFFLLSEVFIAFRSDGMKWLPEVVWGYLFYRPENWT